MVIIDLVDVSRVDVSRIDVSRVDISRVEISRVDVGTSISSLSFWTRINYIVGFSFLQLSDPG